MGVCWITEVISFAVGGSAYLWIPTDILNILTAVFVFIIFVCKPNVWSLLMKRHPNLQRFDRLCPTCMKYDNGRQENEDRSFLDLQQTNIWWYYVNSLLRCIYRTHDSHPLINKWAHFLMPRPNNNRSLLYWSISSNITKFIFHITRQSNGFMVRHQYIPAAICILCIRLVENNAINIVWISFCLFFCLAVAFASKFYLGINQLSLSHHQLLYIRQLNIDPISLYPVMRWCWVIFYVTANNLIKLGESLIWKISLKKKVNRDRCWCGKPIEESLGLRSVFLLDRDAKDRPLYPQHQIPSGKKVIHLIQRECAAE